MAGRDSSEAGVVSHTHASPPAWEATVLKSRRLAGSPSALDVRARSPAPLLSVVAASVRSWIRTPRPTTPR